MQKFKWFARAKLQQAFPALTLSLLANRTWLLEPEIALLPLLADKRGLAIDAGANKFDRTRDQNIASLQKSVKVGRYVNNFIYFHRHEAANRVALIRSAISDTSEAFSETLRPATLRIRVMAPMRAARDIARMAVVRD